MKRRLFLKGLLGASAIAPVVVKAVTSEPQLYKFGDSSTETEGEFFKQGRRIGNSFLTPEQITNEALNMLNSNLSFNSDGTKMYGVDLKGKISKRTLSTAYDISTATYDF